MSKKMAFAVVVLSIFISGLAAAQFPAYYPNEGFQRVGVVDSVQLDRQIIVINDIPYNLANNLIVHSETSYSVPVSKLRLGGQIGYKTAGRGRLISEIWLLPNNYKSPRQRR